MADFAAKRASLIAGFEVFANGVRITALPHAARMSLRAPDESVAALSAALGLELPQKPKRSVTVKARTALWLGPDEWLIIDEKGDPLSACAPVQDLHSAVDVSHRNVAFLISGKRAAEALNAGCPQDLSLAAFPVGACSRTILGKVEIILLRVGEDSFRVECWRSFADYVGGLLTEGAENTRV